MDIYSDLGDPQPLYLQHNTPEIVKTSKGIIHLKANEQIDIFCSDGFRPPLSGGKRKMLIATCISGKTFDINGKSQTMKNVRCTRDVLSETKRTKRKCAAANNTVEIGFRVEGKIKHTNQKSKYIKIPFWYTTLFLFFFFFTRSKSRCMVAIDGNLS